MSRSGYGDGCDDNWSLIRWRGAVESSIRGKRGQAFLKEMLAAMDALPERKLIAEELEAGGAVCAIGSVGRVRGIDMTGIDPEDSARVAATFGIAEPLAREIVFMNDEGGAWNEPAEVRFNRMRRWVERLIRKETVAS